MLPARDRIEVAIDGGTTNTRARVFVAGRAVSSAARPVGVRDTAREGTNASLCRAVAECVAEAARGAGVALDQLGLIAASGMLTSGFGLREVPHVRAPAGRDEIARGVVAHSFPDIAPRPVHFVPGVKTCPRAATADELHALDMLRGEESEVFGILETKPDHGPLAVLLPGSHTKLVRVDAGDRIRAGYSTIAGELMQAVAEHTVLAGSLSWPPPGAPRWPQVQEGARFAARWGLLRAGFAVRLADVMVGQDRDAAAWWFVGAVIASDLGELTRWPEWDGRERVLVAGREPLRSAYAELLGELHGVPVEKVADAVADLAPARGALAIARRAAELAGAGC